MTRAEHLQWCKNRALEILETGRTQEAIASMISDLRKYEETKDHAGILLGAMTFMFGKYTDGEVKYWIEGFN